MSRIADSIRSCASHRSENHYPDTDSQRRRPKSEVNLQDTSPAECIRKLISSGGPTIVFQPVFVLDGMKPVGAEALSRFRELPLRSPNEWFSDAAEAGLQIDLELCAIRNALSIYQDVWKARPIQLGLNVSPTTIVDPRFLDMIRQAKTELLVVEITEHDKVGDYERLRSACARLRSLGVKIAVDDVGAGYASMSHILALRPDIMKLDISIIRDIDKNPMQFALASSLISFAKHFDCKVVGEGVETDEELRCLYIIGMQAVQGFLLSRPVSVQDLQAFLDADDAARQIYHLQL